MEKHKTIYKYNELLLKLYFDGHFVGYERWSDRGWIYSQDGKTWDFKPKYAHTVKILVSDIQYVK